MDKRIQSGLDAFLQRWNQLSFNQRILAGTLLVAMTIAGFFLFQQANDDYDILYANLSLPDASAIVAKLKENGQPYKLADGGTTVMVPRGRKNQLVLETANELTSEQPINLTQIPPVIQGDVQKELIKRVNTDAISKILKTIRGIKNAQVIVSQPKESLFVDDQQPTKASVLLSVDAGFRLRDEQVKTIKNLVSHAVPGLDAENVIIADDSGNPLEGPGGIVTGGFSEADIRRKKFEEETSRKIMSVLAPVVGKENVVVSVSALLNFDQTQARIHRVIPSGGTAENPTGLPVSNQVQTEEYTGGTKPEGGPAGFESNVTPTHQGVDVEEGEEDNKYKLVKKTTNYTNSEEEKSVIYAAGNVERMTVAVVLNKVLTTQETEEIRETVVNAAGVDFARGDSVDIKGFQFSAPVDFKEKELAEAAKAAQEQALIIQLATLGTVLLLGLSAIVVFFILMKKPAEGEIVEDYEEFVEEEPEPVLESKPIPILEAKLEPEVEHMRQSITGMVEADPEEAARVLMTYMKEM